jgi:hypothetical protein
MQANKNVPAGAGTSPERGPQGSAQVGEYTLSWVCPEGSEEMEARWVRLNEERESS